MSGRYHVSLVVLSNWSGETDRAEMARHIEAFLSTMVGVGTVESVKVTPLDEDGRSPTVPAPAPRKSRRPPRP